MQILSLSGLALIAAGIFLLIYTVITAKKGGAFENARELAKIKRSGYTREHREEKHETYRQPAADHSRLMSRRAQRVLEKMEESEPKRRLEQGAARGTALLEEIKAPAQQEERTGLLETQEESKTALLGEKGRRPEMDTATDILPSENATDILKEDNAPESATDILPGEQNTDVLPEEQSMDILGDDQGTDILPPEEQENGETTALLEADEATALLEEDNGEDTALLEDSERTAFLGEATAMLEE